MSKKTVPERIRALREKMKLHNIHFYMIPTADYHQSEYVGEYFKEREYMTGFTGSAGTVLITETNAYLWTDGRYFIQAAKQLAGSSIELMKMGEMGVPTIMDFLKEHLQEGQTIGCDGRCISVATGKRLQEIAQEKNGHLTTQKDLVDEIWEERPSMSMNPVFELGLGYAGESRSEKLVRVRDKMQKLGVNKHVLTTLDDICWLLNLRGNDVEYFPLMLSYCLVEDKTVKLFVDRNKISKGRFLNKNQGKGTFSDTYEEKTLIECLEADGIELLPYEDIEKELRLLQSGDSLLLDPERLNYSIYESIPENVKRVEKRNPEILMKAIKNETEIENIRIAQRKDAVAHVKFMKWLKENVGKEDITEISASEKLDEFRKEQGEFLCPSFDPISSYGEHGAIVHYSATEESNVVLKEGALLLTDTGAGFYEGSTDVTRTYALGEVSDIIKEHFTIVAISNLRLAAAKFMEGCTGNSLDIIARQPFWDRGLNFNHGTGHGVGYLLNIHEGPAAFRWQLRGDLEPLKEGMIITDEPGIYIEGSYGIRLENEVLVRKGERNEYGQFMYLEALTYIPFDLDAIKETVLSERDKELLNRYHDKVYEEVSPYLNKEETEFLRKYTRAI